MNKKMNYLFAFATCLIVFIFYAHTINYEWKHFDEQIIYSETLFPMPLSFLQIFEYLQNLGFRNYIEASNPFYSNIANLRNTPVVFNLLIFWLFKKSAIAYHLLMLFLHILNTYFCFQILSKISKKNNLILISCLTLIWALHPVNVESILLTTNFGALITYSFCLFIFYYYLSLEFKNISLFHSIVLFVLYLIPLLLNEYSVTLQIILFLYIAATSLLFHKTQNNLKEASVYAVRLTIPMFLALLVFVINHFILPKVSFPGQDTILVTLERIFWLSPQIFFHNIKLIFLPIHLSLDQSTFVKISNNIFEPYAIFCFLLLYGSIIFSLISIFNIRKKVYYYFFLLFIPFFLSMVPFLHIISPIYNLSNERYFYLPTFFLIFGAAHVLFDVISRRGLQWQAPTLVILFIFLCVFGTRAYIRTQDWKDSIRLFSSAIKEAKTDLIRALRLEMLGGVLASTNTNEELNKKGYSYIIHGQKILEESFKKLKEENKQENIPLVVKSYGLSQKTILAKTVYLLSFTKAGLEKNIKGSYELLKPFMDELIIFDTQILNFYLDLAFATNNVDEAEKILNKAIETKISPGLLIALAKIQINKYNNKSLAETCLKRAFKYFPYDTSVLESLKSFYQLVNQEKEYAYYSYLHGIRAHSVKSLEEAYTIFKRLNNTKMANKAMENIKLVNIIKK